MADQSVLTPRGEAPPRRKHITAREFWAMIEAGVFQHIENRVELIEGEIIEMAPQSAGHFQVKNLIGRHFVRNEGQTRCFIEPTFTIEDTVVDPDVVVMPVGAADGAIEPGKSLLILEVAVSSVSYDLQRKAAIYAKAGAPEYWVVDVEKLETIMHRGPQADGTWREITRHDKDAQIAPLGAPQLALNLSAL